MKQQDPKGVLVIIGGHEDKEGDCVILKEVAAHLPNRRLVISTVASHEPAGYFEAYQRAFARLGVEDVTELYVDNRAESMDAEKLSQLDGADGLFFSGGDQLRISSQIGDTPFEAKLQALYREGGIVAGTSAGASALGEIMVINTSTERHYTGELHLAPGLGLLPNVIIDQHFAERGRIGRLLGAVALNPRILGIGIDEDTAMVVNAGRGRVIGNGAVYVIDGAGITRSNIDDAGRRHTLSLFDVRLHILGSGDAFDLDKRQPIPAPTDS